MPGVIFNELSNVVPGVNTSLLAGMEDDAHNLILGSKYVNDLLRVATNKKPIIAIGHHGLSLLKDREQKEIARLLDNNGHPFPGLLFLCHTAE